MVRLLKIPKELHSSRCISAHDIFVTFTNVFEHCKIQLSLYITKITLRSWLKRNMLYTNETSIKQILNFFSFTNTIFSKMEMRCVKFEHSNNLFPTRKNAIYGSNLKVRRSSRKLIVSKYFHESEKIRDILNLSSSWLFCWKSIYLIRTWKFMSEIVIMQLQVFCIGSRSLQSLFTRR